MKLKRSIYSICLIAVFALFSCGEKKHELDSIDGMNAALTDNPADTAARFARAKYYQAKGRNDSALADMQVLVKTDSLRPDYYLTMADIYLAVNQTRYTRKALQRAISLNSELELAHMKLAELYLYVEMRQEALNELNEVLKRNKNNPKGYYLKGMIYKESGDTALAISSFITTTEQDPNYALAYEQLGLIYADKGDKRCLDFYTNALRINPKNSLTRYNIGYFYQSAGDTANALKTYRELIAIDSKFANAYYNIGYILFELKNNPKAAVPYFLQAAAAKPGYVEAIYMSGLCNEQLGNKELALKDYSTAIKLDPNFTLAQSAFQRLGGKP
jgi:tetratricopeptide (TPR) repeat protein